MGSASIYPGAFNIIYPVPKSRTPTLVEREIERKWETGIYKNKQNKECKLKRMIIYCKIIRSFASTRSRIIQLSQTQLNYLTIFSSA